MCLLVLGRFIWVASLLGCKKLFFFVLVWDLVVGCLFNEWGELIDWIGWLWVWCVFV